jgi:hypothetical protein
MMSAMQKYRAAASFARRHAFIDGYGVRMKGEDIEGTNEDEPPATTIMEPQPKYGVKVQDNGKKVETPVTVDTLKAIQQEVQDTYTEMAKVIGQLPGGEPDRYFSKVELKKEFDDITEHKADAIWLRGWLATAKVELSNRKIDRELAERTK